MSGAKENRRSTTPTPSSVKDTVMKVIAWSLIILYLLVIGLWPAAAAPVDLAATGALVVIVKPPVLLLTLAAGALLSFRRRPVAAPARKH